MTAHVLLIKRDNGALTPARAADAEALAGYPKGAAIKAVLTLPKSGDMLRWYWALIGHVAKGIGRDKEALSHELLLRTGRFESLVLSTGREHFIPSSIAAMQYPQFKAYVDDAVELILSDFLQGIRRADLLREIGRMTGTNYSDFPAAEAREEPAQQDHAVGETSPNTAPLFDGEAGEAGATSSQTSAPASSIYDRYDAALWSVTNGGPAALAKARKAFIEANSDVTTAQAAKTKAIYAAHTERLTGGMTDDQCRARIAAIIGGAP